MAAEDPKRTYVERALRRQLDDLRADLERREQIQRALADLVGRAEVETRRLEERFAEVEQQHSNLAALYAASYQLHASLRRAEVLLTMQEIVINLVGSEELAILAIGPGGFTPLALVGVEPALLARLRPDAGLVGDALATGQPVVAGPRGAGDDGVTACIPLTAAGRTLGVVAIFRLLPQKPVLQAIDMELFGLLGHHAATALYCAELHERHGQGGGSGEPSC